MYYPPDFWEHLYAEDDAFPPIEYMDDEEPSLTRTYGLRMFCDGLPKAIRYSGNVPYPPPPPVDAGAQPPAVDAGAQPPPVDAGAQPPAVDAGAQPPAVDAGAQPPADAGAQPPADAGAQPLAVDAGAQPPADAGAQPLAVDAGAQPPAGDADAPPPPPMHTRDGSCNAILKGDSRRRCTAIKKDGLCHVDVHNRCRKEFFLDGRWQSCARHPPCGEHAPKCGALTQAGKPCSWPKETCTVHNVDAASRCESCSWKREPCMLPKKPDCMYCACHMAFPNQIRVLDELVVAHGVGVTLQQFLSRFPGQEMSQIEFSRLCMSYVQKTEADIANGDDRVPPAVVDTFRKAATDANMGTVAGDAQPNAVAGDAQQEAVAGDAPPNAVAGDAQPNAVAGDAQQEAVAGDAPPNAVAGDAQPNAVAGDAQQDTVAGGAQDTVAGDGQLIAVAGDAQLIAVAGDAQQATPTGGAEGTVPVLIRSKFCEAFTIWVQPGTTWQQVKSHGDWKLAGAVRAFHRSKFVPNNFAIQAGVTITLERQSSSAAVLRCRAPEPSTELGDTTGTMLSTTCAMHSTTHTDNISATTIDNKLNASIDCGFRVENNTEDIKEQVGKLTDMLGRGGVAAAQANLAVARAQDRDKKAKRGKLKAIEGTRKTRVAAAKAQKKQKERAFKEATTAQRDRASEELDRATAHLHACLIDLEWTQTAILNFDAGEELGDASADMMVLGVESQKLIFIRGAKRGPRGGQVQTMHRRYMRAM